MHVFHIWLILWHHSNIEAARFMWCMSFISDWYCDLNFHVSIITIPQPIRFWLRSSLPVVVQGGPSLTPFLPHLCHAGGEWWGAWRRLSSWRGTLDTSRDLLNRHSIYPEWLNRHSIYPECSIMLIYKYVYFTWKIWLFINRVIGWRCVTDIWRKWSISTSIKLEFEALTPSSHLLFKK